MNELELKNLAFHLKKFREKNNISQTKLAEKLQISRASLSHYEHAKSEPPLYTLVRISKLLNISTDSLLGLNNQDNNTSIFYPDYSLKIFELNDLIKLNKKTLSELISSKKKSDKLLENLIVADNLTNKTLTELTNTQKKLTKTLNEVELIKRRTEKLNNELIVSKKRTEKLNNELISSKKRTDLILNQLNKNIDNNYRSFHKLNKLTSDFFKISIDNKALLPNLIEEYTEELVPEIENSINSEPSYKKKESFLERYLIDLTENENLSRKFMPVNVLGSVKCGSPGYAYKEVSSTLALPAKYKDCYLLKADGDSMNKLFHDGELIVCCPNKIPHNNDIVVAYIPEHEEATCKKLKCEHQTLELHPCSTMAYEIQRYDENSDVQIMSVVLGSLSDILEKENIDINELEEELGNYS